MGQAEARRAAGLPVLPREVLADAIAYLSLPASEGDWPATQALLRLSSVCRLVRHWALSALYDVLVLPRHITRLTQTSAGWEAELLRLLHHCGSTIEYLSLWQTESRALLRDAAQVSGQHTKAAWAVGEASTTEADDAEHNAPAVDQDMPRWLQDELARAPAETVARQHLAHFPLVPRALPTPAAWRQRPPARLCTPRCLSLVMYYPFYENERPELFARMVVWSRVEELDVYVPMEPRKSLQLLAQLGHTPVWRLRISAPHATIAIESHSDRWSNACAVLLALVSHPDLETALVNELRGRATDDAHVLEAACLRYLAGAHMPAIAQPLDEVRHWQAQLRVRLTLTQKNQAVWGKLRHRLWDFRERAQHQRPGAWAELLRD
ncbi:unnamed protein product [Malassezia sympodialis ATCC 42132]|uniref:uncharacterized protein n=1 Tax=Malassezia sympodialis (strain ATCC 42132) TaxID=1230383 RepID=UPI0002C25001|nr:uncharacterized protein MSY001_2411 [Malassezia sympodialis ATCC 42132]CCU99705.1 unnamed protein product [Malassezia sympodialis ATCC 42132]|eukprot:XP_018740938.1 uncharacterized protein MSY001_2411 [Malassezia sympodialis ATCC 42132]